MKSYSYIAQDARHKQVRGTINAENEQEFMQRIKEKGLFVKEYTEGAAGDAKSLYKFNTQELSFCCRQPACFGAKSAVLGIIAVKCISQIPTCLYSGHYLL